MRERAKALSLDEYNEWLRKFKERQVNYTTDDCFTPPEDMKAVSDWVANEYGKDPSLFVRPFYPGGDYKRDAETYSNGEVVVDNPPFSLFAQIIRFYQEKGIPFFVFAPTLTSLSSTLRTPGVCMVFTGSSLTYDNSAVVNTSFATNMEPEAIIRTAPTLHDKLTESNRRAVLRMRHGEPVKRRRLVYPDCVVRSTDFSTMALRGVEFSVSAEDMFPFMKFDNGQGVFGGGAMLSPAKTEELQRKRREVGFKRDPTPDDVPLLLSDRELERWRNM